MPLIKYEGDNLHTIRGRGDLKVRFVPGTNEVPSEVWDPLVAQAEKEEGNILIEMLETGKLKVLSAPRVQEGPRKPQKVGEAREPENKPDSLKDVDIARMASPEALEMIKGIVSVTHLENFLSQEKARKAGPRKTLLAALEEQLKIAKEPLGGPPEQGLGADPTKGNQPPSRVRQMLGLDKK